MLILLLISLNCYGRPSITYRLNTGRLGDHIITYLKCLRAAQKYNLHFIPTPFKHSEHFFSSSKNLRIYRSNIKDEAAIIRHLDTDALLVIDYSFRINLLEAIKDPEFKSMIQETFLIEPKEEISVPNGYTSVAIHIRKGSSNDPPLFADQTIRRIKGYAEYYWPLKFPPNQYYVDQLRYLVTLFPNEKLFIYIFTDHKNPLHLKQLFEEIFKEYPHFIFSCRDKSIAYQKTIVEDLVSMAQFDCLIRSESNFSKVAHFIGNNKIVIYPISSHWENDKMIIDKKIVTDSKMSYKNTVNHQNT